MFTLFACDTQCWQLWASFFTVVTGIVIVITLLVTLAAAKTQFDEMKKARSLTIFLETQRLLELDERWKLRRFIYRIQGMPGKLSGQEQDRFEEFIRYIDTVGHLVKKTYIDPNDFLELWFNIVLRLWTKASPYVMYERERRGDPNWAIRFQWLAQQAELYRAKHFPNLKVSLYDGETTDQTTLEDS